MYEEPERKFMRERVECKYFGEKLLRSEFVQSESNKMLHLNMCCFFSWHEIYFIALVCNLCNIFISNKLCIWCDFFYYRASLEFRKRNNFILEFYLRNKMVEKVNKTRRLGFVEIMLIYRLSNVFINNSSSTSRSIRLKTNCYKVAFWDSSFILVSITFRHN